VNRYLPPRDPKAVRRGRLRVQGPEGEQPPEFDPVHLSRVMRCPKCRQTIATMRRWRMLCPECGHEWEEESVLSLGDKLSDLRTEAWGFIFLALAWATIIAFGLAILGLLVLFYVWLKNIGATTISAALIVVFGLFVLTMIAMMLRPSREIEARYQWWVTPWRNNRERD
jgi:hypothetical protein